MKLIANILKISFILLCLFVFFEVFRNVLRFRSEEAFMSRVLELIGDKEAIQLPAVELFHLDDDEIICFIKIWKMDGSPREQPGRFQILEEYGISLKDIKSKVPFNLGSPSDIRTEALAVSRDNGSRFIMMIGARGVGGIDVLKHHECYPKNQIITVKSNLYFEIAKDND